MTKNNNTHKSPLLKSYDKKINQCCLFLKRNKNVIFTTIDKGNSTICLNKSLYIRSGEALLSNREIYQVVTRTKTLLKRLHKQASDRLKLWQEQGYLKPNQNPYELTQTHTSIPAIYFPPKLQKIQNMSDIDKNLTIPVRPVTPNFNSHTSLIAKTLHYHLNSCIKKPNSYIKNSLDLCEKIKKISIPQDHKLLSFDVSSLFTNIPLELVINSLDRRYNDIHNKCKMPFTEVVDTIKYLYNNIYCTFNHIIYKQLEGTPMGSAISSLLADIVMDDLETTCIKQLSYTPLFYYRYVDDIILCIPQDKIEYTLNIFNNYHQKLQFTFEIEENNKINFLDITLIKKDNSIITNWYTKNTFSGRILHYASSHPVHQKIAMVYNLVDRAIILADTIYHKVNIQIVNNILLANKYPKQFIDKYINKRWELLKNNDYKVPRTINSNNNTYRNKIFVKVPYKPGIYPKINQVLDKEEYCIIPQLNDDMKKIVRKGKIDKIENKTGVVYKFKCNDCPNNYVGETKRPLFMRIEEHIRDKQSVIATHSTTHHHSFNFNKPKIMDQEKTWGKRKISESMQIQLNGPTVNLKEDTNILNCSYIHTINMLQ